MVVEIGLQGDQSGESFMAHGMSFYGFRIW
jgi:hypothetical protein